MPSKDGALKGEKDMKQTTAVSSLFDRHMKINIHRQNQPINPTNQKCERVYSIG